MLLLVVFGFERLAFAFCGEALVDSMLVQMLFNVVVASGTVAA